MVDNTIAVYDGSGTSRKRQATADASANLVPSAVVATGVVPTPVSATNPLFSAPGQFTVADPDISVVATASTAVTAFAAGHVAKGGWIKNPSAAAGPLFIRLTGAAGTSESGGTCSVAAGQSYVIPPMSGTVSVNAADAGHLFCGVGYQ